MATKILVMGLPGSGKTTLSNELKKQFENYGSTVDWFNADDLRNQFNDWDFSIEGRIRQSKRMTELANKSICDYVICDFVAPLVEIRIIFNPDYIVWMNTIKNSIYQDTNSIFVQPTNYDFVVEEMNSVMSAKSICKSIIQNNDSNYLP